MAKPSFSTFNLTMLNLWIALTKGDPKVPRELYALGYRHKGIEWRFQNAKRESVQPELIVASDSQEHTCLLEWKSGKNADNAQLRRYGNVTQMDVQTCAGVTPQAAKSHDVVIVSQSEHVNTITMGMATAKVSFPLISCEDSGLALVKNGFANKTLDKVFTPVLPIDWDHVPTSFVPLDADSPRWRVAEVIMPKVIKHMAHSQPMVDVLMLCEEACPLWGSMNLPARQVVEARAREVLDDAMGGEFKAHLSFSGTGKKKLVISNNPFDNPTKRTANLRKLKTAQKNLIARLKAGVSAAGVEQTRIEFPPDLPVATLPTATAEPEDLAGEQSEAAKDRESL